MKYIDLLPKKERAFNKRTIALNAVIVLLIILLAAMVMYFIVIKDRAKDLNSNLAQYQETGARLEEYVDKLEIYEQFEIKVQKKSQLVDSIEDKDVLWSDIIYNLGEAVPPKASLTDFEGSMAELENFVEEYSEETSGQKVTCFTIRGYANEYTDVSRLIIGLKKIPYIGDAWVESISQAQISEGVNGLNFTVATFWDTGRLIEEWDISEQEEEPEQQQDLEQELE